MTSHPRYLLQRPLGEGGMAVIHLATQYTPAGERLVAIKQIERREEVGSVAHARLVTEARLVFQLTHGNICQVLDLGENAQGTFIVIEYVHGCDLGELISAASAAGGGLDVPLCLYVAREVARALDYAHRRTDAGGRMLGLVHGDVAPRNVLLSVEGEVKLADFGIARARGVLAPGSGLVGGTPGFIAPEVVNGVNDLRSDVYSLGMTIVRALGDGPDKVAGRTDLGGLREIVVRATSREPSARFPSAGEMERALALELARRYPGFTPTVLAHAVSRLVAEREARRSRATVASGTATTFAMHTLIDRPALATAAAAPFTEPPLPLGGVTATVVPARRQWVARRRRRRRLIALASGGLVAALGASIALGLALRDESGDKVILVGRAARSDEPALSANEPVAEAPALVLSRTPDDTGTPEAAPVPSAPGDAGAAPVVQDAVAAADSPDRPSGRRKGTRQPAARPASRDPAFVSVSATPWGAVYIDGKRVARETPLYRHPLPAGRHEVRVYFTGEKVYSERRTVDLTPGQHRSIGFER